MKIKEYTHFGTWYEKWLGRPLRMFKKVPKRTWFCNGKPTPLAMKVYFMAQVELRKEKKKGAWNAKKKNAYNRLAKKLGLSGGEKIQIMCHQVDKFLTLDK
jgi:hypothetical protein